MPIIAVCPYCRQGKVRAPERAVGLSFPCPRCRSSFTLTPSGEPDEPPAKPSPGTDTHPAKRTAPVAAAETSAHAVPAVATAAAPPAPEPPPEPEPEPIPAVSYAAVAASRPAPGEATDPGLPWALVGLTLAGVGLAASQLPYGRFALTGLAAAGLLVAWVAALAAERNRLVPAAACGANVLGLLLAVAFPGVLDLGPWRPAAPPDESKLVKAVGRDGDVALSAEWVDAGKASWQQDDVRVSVRSAAVGPIELAGPNNQKKWTKEKVLQIGLRVANVGVARQFEFRGWESAAPDGTLPRLTDAAGKPVPAKRFEPGWAPAAAPDRAGPLFPGKAAEYLLVFEAPARPGGDLRLELPAAAFGGEVPVRLLLPASFVGMR